jgi:hypothetical protein
MRRRTIGAILLGLAVNFLLIGPYASLATFRRFGDFSSFYIGAQLGEARYDIPVVMETQKKILSEVRPALMPTRLPFYYALLWPIGRLRYPVAAALWTVVMIGCAVAAVLVDVNRDRLALAAAWAFSPLVFGIVDGQDVALMCLVLGVGLRLRSAGRPFAAGLVLSLLAIKFHLFLLLPVAFVVMREFVLLRGALAGSAALAGASFLAGGQDWVMKYVHLLRNPAVSPGPNRMPNLHGLVASLPHSGIIEAVLVALVSVFVLVTSSRRPEKGVAIALLGSFLVSFHAYSADVAVIVPQLLAVFQARRSIAALLCLAPIPYVYGAYGFGFVPAALIGIVLVQEAGAAIFARKHCGTLRG